MNTIYKIYLFSFFTLFSFKNSIAQIDISQAKGIQISLITCGVGAEIYSVFGHTAVRIIDSNKGTDIVYNYGTFDGYDKDFEINFMRGKLLYYLSEDPFNDFIHWYGSDGRWVKEQVINGSKIQKLAIKDFLETNMLPENRVYKYDFFFDNCATRIRDIFTQTFGPSFQYPNVLPSKTKITFRDIINQYLANNVWERFGINILLGSKIDKAMSNAEIMFLPDFLNKGIEGAKLDNKPFAKPTKTLLEEIKQSHKTDWSVYFVLHGLLLLVVLGIFIPQMKIVSIIVSNLMLLITGLLGILILFMWFGTDHQTCANNYNLLWALPTNVLFVFKKKQYKYSLIAIILIFVSLLLHLLHIQALLLPEMVPFLLCLLIIFAVNYRKAKKINNAKNTTQE